MTGLGHKLNYVLNTFVKRTPDLLILDSKLFFSYGKRLLLFVTSPVTVIYIYKFYLFALFYMKTKIIFEKDLLTQVRPSKTEGCIKCMYCSIMHMEMSMQVKLAFSVQGRSVLF